MAWKVIYKPDKKFSLQERSRLNKGLCPSDTRGKCPCEKLVENGECEYKVYIRIPFRRSDAYDE